MNQPFKIKNCIYKRGKYYWVKWYQNGKARYQSTKMTNKELALEEAERIVISFYKEKGIITKDIMMYELIDKVEEDLKEKLQNKTIAKKTFLFYKVFLVQINKELGSYFISQLTVEDIEAYLKKRRLNNNLSVTTIRDEHLTLNKIFKYGIARGYCKENLMEKISKPKKKNRAIIQNKPYIITEEQVKTLLGMATPYLSEIIQFLYNTGIRRGELENLRFEDVDMEKGLIFIRANEGDWQPKGGKERTIPINEIVRKILTQKISTRKKNQQYVFVSTTGKKAYNYHKSFHKLMKKSGIADKIPDSSWKGVHLLRHSFCSYLVNEAQVPLPIVQEIMGHQDIKTTMIYIHSDERQKRQAIQKFDYIRNFKKLREEGKSFNDAVKLISEKFNIAVQEVEDTLIGVR